MLTFIFLLILGIILYFITKKLFRQKLVIERLKKELNECKIHAQKLDKKSKKGKK